MSEWDKLWDKKAHGVAVTLRYLKSNVIGRDWVIDVKDVGDKQQQRLETIKQKWKEKPEEYLWSVCAGRMVPTLNPIYDKWFEEIEKILGLNDSSQLEVKDDKLQNP